MLWNHKKKKRQDESNQSSLTVGQKTDIFEMGAELFIRSGGGSPFNHMLLAGAGFDLAVSTHLARPGQKSVAAAGVFAGQVGAIAGYYAGEAVGAMLGSFVLPVGGTWVGKQVGGAIGMLAGDQISRTGAKRFVSRAMATRPHVNFGGYQDTEPAYTQRQKSEQQLNGSLLNARRYLGQEAQLMHQ